MLALDEAAGTVIQRSFGSKVSAAVDETRTFNGGVTVVVVVGVGRKRGGRGREIGRAHV